MCLGLQGARSTSFPAADCSFTAETVAPGVSPLTAIEGRRFREFWDKLTFQSSHQKKIKQKKCADRVPMSCNSFVTFLTKTNRIMTCVCCSHETVQSTRRHPAHPASVYPSTSSTPMVRLPVDIQHTHSSIARADSSS